ncbi:MAG TPA: hypothetical protein VM939_06265, partial [Gemmatimonadaceae bacterium]|nr:hypothetical protein [Gemmatimonadaceae bacterium]
MTVDPPSESQRTERRYNVHLEFDNRHLTVRTDLLVVRDYVHENFANMVVRKATFPAAEIEVVQTSHGYRVDGADS